jgi:cell division protein FtsN
MLITGLLIGLVVFGVYLKGAGLKKLKQHLPQNPITAPVTQVTKPSGLSPEAAEKLEQQPDSLPPEVAIEVANGEMPQFDFYTILPEKEAVVPEHEIMKRTRAEIVPPLPAETSIDVTTPTIPVETPTKSTTAYMMQAGSFKNSTDAEKMCTNLESMGIEARVERAKVGETIWHRIKLGPYTQMTSVSAIRTRLKQSGIDVIVTETGGH